MTERSHLVRMHIKNIGCIGGDGLTVELDNIVCLVGANNSGKTTVLKAYDAAVRQKELKPDEFHFGAQGEPATVELWVHIPKTAANVDEKWKECQDDLLLVRSKWEWPVTGGKPIRSTWDPTIKEYAANGKASGLDTVFNSRLPQPLRIGSLEDPDEEHRKLLALVLEPIASRYMELMQDKNSDLRKKIIELQTEAEKPVAEFQDQLEKVQSKVNFSYKQVFNASEIKLTVSLGEVGFDPQKNLASASRVDIAEKNGQTRWDQQGTGSQRALFWSMLQVRSELNRLSEIQRQRSKNEADIMKLEQKINKTKADESKLSTLKEKLTVQDEIEQDIFLPGYMLLIDEPETALHPAAVRAAKDYLYALASEVGWQVMLSTHHPAFIDPLNDHTTIVRLHRIESHLPPNIYRSEAMHFDGTEIENLKALLVFDAGVSEMFFGSKVLIVEGDTEYAAFSEVMILNPDNYPPENRPLIIRARGKATIATLVKMLTHFKISFSVLHDIDLPRTENGQKVNPAYSINKRIGDAIQAARQSGLAVVYRCSCPNFEQHHKMDLPSKDKPYEAWRAVRETDSVLASVRSMLDSLLTLSSNNIDAESDGLQYEVQIKSWIDKQTDKLPAFKFSDSEAAN